MKEKNYTAHVIGLILIIFAILAFSAYSKKEDERQRKAYQRMWRDLYSGYSEKESTKKTTVPSQKSSTTQKRSTSIKKKPSESSDPLNVKDYRDPEDFYYDNYDDFFDYEEAEDYYYEHGGF